MTDWGPIDTLELAWAREHRDHRETLADVCSATRRDIDEWHEALRTCEVDAPPPAAIARRIEIVRQSVLEGWSIKEIARRARAPRAFAVAIAAGLAGWRLPAEPLDPAALECLRRIAGSPTPAQAFPPGLVSRLQNDGWAHIDMRPSVHARRKGEKLGHLRITEAGIAALELQGARP